MKGLVQFLNEARVDLSGVDSQIINKIANTDSVSDSDMRDLITQLKKVDYKPLQDFLDIINILSLSGNELMRFNIYKGDKDKIKRITKVDKSLTKLESNLPNDYLIAIDKLVVHLFLQKASKNVNKIHYSPDVLNALKFNVAEYITSEDEEINKSSLGDFRGWYDKCRDLALAGSFNQATLSKSYRDFRGLLEDYSKHINKYISKLNDKQLSQTKLIDALIRKDKNEIANIIHSDKTNAFDPYVIQYVDRSGFSYILCVVMQLAIQTGIDKNAKPDVLTSLIPDQFIKYINKVLN